LGGREKQKFPAACSSSRTEAEVERREFAKPDLYYRIGA
jgi:hypothetical protein